MLNAILGYCGEEGVCQIRQELMGLRKLLFKARLEQQQKINKLNIINFSYLLPCFQHTKYSNSDF